MVRTLGQESQGRLKPNPILERRRRASRAVALARAELRETQTHERRSAASPTSYAIKVLDTATVEAIARYMVERQKSVGK